MLREPAGRDRGRSHREAENHTSPDDNHPGEEKEVCMQKLFGECDTGKKKEFDTREHRNSGADILHFIQQIFSRVAAIQAGGVVQVTEDRSASWNDGKMVDADK